MMLPHHCQLKYSSRADWLDERLDAPADWLSSAELAELARLRDAGRRRQWLAGRRIGKQLVGEKYGAAVNDVQILSRDEQQRGVRPRIYVDGQPIAWSLSLSHSETGAMALLAATEQLSVGVDLVGEVPSNSGFRQLWFTARERRWLEQDTQRRTTLLWGLKEAIYKACNMGESWMPQAVEILPNAAAFQCEYRGELLRGFCCYAWNLGRQLAVFASVPRVARKHEDKSSRSICTSTAVSNQEAIALCS